MRTIVTKNPAEAAEVIKSGGICAFPTETVYGLGANVFDQLAVTKIFEAKRRPVDNPLIAHISSIDQIVLLSSGLTENARKFINAFFPGPLTIVVAKSPAVPLVATAGLETIGIRMPRFELAHEFLEYCGLPVVAPSANLSGFPSPTTWEAVYEDLSDRIDCILQGESTEIGLESTVVDCTGAVPVLLRKGGVSLDQLRLIVPETTVYEALNDEPARSPGMRHKHYSPRARVKLVERGTLIDRGNSSAFIGLEKPQGVFALTRICSSVDEYGRLVFAFFRECDAEKIDTIYCQQVPESGIGAALMDRLRRASGE
jgi:L-threonylcarbamoyladenylate synthase